MLLPIPNVLTFEQITQARQALEQADWVDGRVTAGHQSARAKDNQQLAEDHPAARQLGDMILSSLGQNALFISSALPLHVFPPLFNRYQGGHSFGVHVDNAIRQVQGSGRRIRTDLSATLFLADPLEYDGGAGRTHDSVSGDQLAPGASGDAGRACGLILLDTEYGAG
jgi:PKHD-type hydroxylase